MVANHTLFWMSRILCQRSSRWLAARGFPSTFQDPCALSGASIYCFHAGRVGNSILEYLGPEQCHIGTKMDRKRANCSLSGDILFLFLNDRHQYRCQSDPIFCRSSWIAPSIHYHQAGSGPLCCHRCCPCTMEAGCYGPEFPDVSRRLQHLHGADCWRKSS
jgi:hypothetical protein